MARRNRGKEDPWRTRRVMEMYASGEAISEIAKLVGWSEGRVRKVLREAGVAVPDGEGGDGRGIGIHEEDRKRLFETGWESKLRGGLIVWHRPDGHGSWYTEDVALEIQEAMEEGTDGDGSYP
jgi:hypothetical protein